VSTRTALAYAAGAVAVALLNLLVMVLAEDLVVVDDKREAIAGFPILLLLLGIVGAAGEYRHRTAAPAALAAGRGRGQVLVGRALAYALTGAAIATLSLAVTFAVGLPLLGGEPGPGLDSRDLVLVGAGSVLAAAISAIMGVAVGALARNQVAAVIGTLLLLFVATPLLQLVSQTMFELTPFAAATVVAGGSAEILSWGGAALVLAAWTLPLTAAAILLERRRDVG
jgi:ABC-type transport system involved in multi-copper enzyme maturation permease subunit